MPFKFFDPEVKLLTHERKKKKEHLGILYSM